MRPAVVVILIAAACSSGSRPDASAMARLCDAPTFPERAPAVRDQAISQWVDANIRDPEARAAFAALGSLPRAQHGAHLRQAAAQRGLKTCALADAIDRELAASAAPPAPAPAPDQPAPAAPPASDEPASDEPTPAAPTVRWNVELTGAKATAGGSVTHEHLMQKVQSAYMAGLRRCATRAASAGPLTVTFTVEEHGRTTDVSVRAGVRELADCVRQLAGTWRFAAPTDATGAAATVEAELTFLLTPP